MIDAAWEDYLDELASRGPAKPPATLGEAWLSSWRAGGLTTLGGAGAPRVQALDELRAAYQTAAGSDPRETARQRGIWIDDARPDEEAAVIEMLSRELPEPAQKHVAPHLDIEAKAAAIGAKIEGDAAEVRDRTFGFTPNAAAVLAGLARTMVDPPTLIATAGVAAVTPAGVGLPAFLAREAAVNAGQELVTRPIVNLQRESIGLEPAPLFESVIESAVAGAALGGLFKAGGWAAKRAFSASRSGESFGGVRNIDAAGQPLEAPLARAGEAPDAGVRIGEGDGGAKPENAQESAPRGFSERFDAPPAARGAVASIEPEDFDLAARHVENRAIEDAGALRADALGVAEHARAIDDAVAALDRGEGASLAPPAFDAAAEARAAAIDARAAELSPTVFARANALDSDLANARAEIQRINARPTPNLDATFEARAAEIEQELATITGKRRSSPRAKALREELDAFKEQRSALIAQQQAINEEKLSVLRSRIMDMQHERAVLGPRVRAVRAHAAQMLGGDNAQALAFAGARDARREAVGEPLPISRQSIEGKTEAGAPVGQVEPARPLSDYPLREVAPEPVKPGEGAAAKKQPTPGAKPDQAAQKPSLGATPELAALRADAERAIAEAGDFEIHLPDDDGNMRAVKASAALRDVDEDAIAAREFELCLLASDLGEAAE